MVSEKKINQTHMLLRMDDEHMRVLTHVAEQVGMPRETFVRGVVFAACAKQLKCSVTELQKKASTL